MGNNNEKNKSQRSVKKRLMTVSVVSVIIACAVLCVVSVLSLRNTVLENYIDIAKASATHIEATIEGLSEGDWSYNEKTNELYKGDTLVTDKFFDIIQKENADIHHTIFWGNTRIMSDLTDAEGKSVVGTTCDDSVLQNVKASGCYVQNSLQIQGKPYTVCYYGMYNGGELVGMVFVGIVQQAANMAVFNVALLVIIISAAMCVVLVLIVRRIVRGISNNLNQRLNKGSEDLKASGADIIRLSDNTLESIDQVSQAIDQVASAATSQAQHTEEAQAGVQDFGDSIEKIVRNIDDCQNNSKEVESSLSDTNKVVDVLMEDAKNNSEKIDEITDKLRENAESIGEIRKIIKAIDDIAFQITLLSFNASVEATHAGEYGAGFSVVADQIKNLSEKTKESAAEINAMIEDTISKIEETSALSVELQESNRNESDSLNKAYNQIENLSGSIQDVAYKLNDITDEASSLIEVKSEIVENIQSLAATSEENAAMAEEIQASAFQIADIMANLDEQVKGLDDVAVEMNDVIVYFEGEKKGN